MKKVLRRICATSVCLLLCLPCAAEFSEWTSRTGERIEAEFLNLEDGYVRLKTRGDKILRIQLSDLSEKSQADAKQTVSPEETPTEKPRDKPVGKIPRVDPEKLVSVVVESEGKAVLSCRFDWHEVRISDDRKELDRYIAEKKTVFEISGRLISKKRKHSDSAPESQPGYFYILNGANEVVVSDTFEVEVDRKSSRTPAEYIGFLPGAGVYTAVIWTEYAGENMGRASTRFIPSY